MNAEELWQRAAAAIAARGIPVEPAAVDGAPVPPVVTLGEPGGTAHYVVHPRRTPTRATLAAVAARSPDVAKPLVVVPYMTPGMAAHCRDLGLEFVDAAGNMLLVLPFRWVDIEGRRAPEEASVARTPGRVFQPSGLRVVFALLCAPDLVAAPYRVVAGESGTALGSVQRVVSELVAGGYVEQRGRARLLHDTRRLFDKWVEAYDRTLRPRLLLHRFDTDDLTPWTSGRVAVARAGAQWGGESAAALLTGHLRPGGAVVYADEVPRVLVQRHRLRRADDGRIEFRRRFWGERVASTGQAPDCVPSPLVYADLMASAESRQVEVATLLRENDDVLRRIDSA